MARRRSHPRLYTTPIAMDDLDDVRDALGYERINIAAASYGTLAAQAYMRQHPDRVRSAFLVGIVTPGFKLPLPFARAAQNVLDLLVGDCAADRACHHAFPNAFIYPAKRLDCSWTATCLRAIERRDRRRSYLRRACQPGGRADEVVGFCCTADGSIRRTPPFS